MRRSAILLAALGLTLSLASPALAAPPPRPGVTASFAMWSDDLTVFEGHVAATIQVPTTRDYLPGTYDFTGAPTNWIHESHMLVGQVEYWFDETNAPGGARVAFAQGVECVYSQVPGDVDCHPNAMMFVDNVDPAIPDQMAFATSMVGDEWDFLYWSKVGAGTLRVTLPAGW